MRLLVTGASGFVGRHLLPAAVADGWTLRCASRDPRRAREAAPAHEWVRADLDDPASLGPALEGVDAAVG